MNLSNNRETALKQIADGYGREPTTAHPDCRCGRPYQPSCPTCHAQPNQPCHIGNHLERDLEISVGQHHTRPATQRDCPMHKPSPKP